MPNKRSDPAAAPINEDLPREDLRRSQGAVLHPGQGQRDQDNDDERIEVTALKIALSGECNRMMFKAPWGPMDAPSCK